jgi:hypothetical protein
MMRIVLALCVAALCFATAAEAQNNFKLKGFFTRADVNKACKAAGGVPSGNNDVYGCIKDNCDGKGGYCGVQCDKSAGECKGTTPTRTAGSNSDPFQVLRPERADQFAIPEPIGRGMADNTDRPGSDFQSFHARSAAECQSACLRYNTCKAWTYVRPGYQGNRAVCYFKKAVPPARNNSCCVSGVNNANHTTQDLPRATTAKICCLVRGGGPSRFQWRTKDACRRADGRQTVESLCANAPH